MKYYDCPDCGRKNLNSGNFKRHLTIKHGYTEKQWEVAKSNPQPKTEAPLNKAKFDRVFKSVLERTGSAERAKNAALFACSKSAPEPSVEGTILKMDEEQRLVWGWASVVSSGGIPIIDRQGDVIEADTMVKAANKFMEDVRVGKLMHSGDQIGLVVHSLPLTKEIGDSLGVHSDREGWIVAFKVHDDEVWESVKSGQLKAFSIGGKAKRETI